MRRRNSGLLKAIFVVVKKIYLTVKQNKTTSNAGQKNLMKALMYLALVDANTTALVGRGLVLCAYCLIHIHEVMNSPED